MNTIDSVKVRMYRHGFGDCFLLQFLVGGQRVQSILIDCGLKLNDQVPGITLVDVRDDIERVLKGGNETVKSPRLDVLVVTHEHWDHVSGFHPDQKLYDHFDIGSIWMAWTENPKDKDAVTLNRGLQKRITALKLATEKLQENRPKQTAFYAQFDKQKRLLAARDSFNTALEEVLNFFGPLTLDKTASGISIKDSYKISSDTQKAIDHVRSFTNGDAGIRYCYPGDLIQDKIGLPSVNVFVLGPPKNKLLNKDAPSKGSNREVYFGDNSSVAGLVDGLLARWASSDLPDESRPFIDVCAISVEAAKKDPYLKKHYYDKAQAWRIIEEDWLDFAGALALQMDSDTNNTSLALAFQLPGGKVLLFPGDAQVGNWLSWHDLQWNIQKGNSTEIVNATKLLQNTVLYKVGHHASHNATLQDLGLELMISDELVAFIPEKEKQYHGIPFAPLVERLNEKTKGRLLFSADSRYDPQQVSLNKPSQLNTQEWQHFKKNLTVDRLYIEYVINV